MSPHHEGSLPEEGFRSSSSPVCETSRSRPGPLVHSRGQEVHQDRLPTSRGASAEAPGGRRKGGDWGEGGRGGGQREREEAVAAATTAVEPPNSTASTMEAGGSGEGPDSGALLLHIQFLFRLPLECLMRDMGLEAKEEDIIFSHHPHRQASSLWPWTFSREP